MVKLADEIWKTNFETKNLEIRLIGIQMNNLGEIDVTQKKMSSFLTSDKKTNPFESKTVHIKTKMPRRVSVQMVKNQRNLCRSAYLDNAIFKPSKMKLVQEQLHLKERRFR